MREFPKNWYSNDIFKTCQKQVGYELKSMKEMTKFPKNTSKAHYSKYSLKVYQIFTKKIFEKVGKLLLDYHWWSLKN
jgi:hypothetical protein